MWISGMVYLRGEAQDVPLFSKAECVLDPARFERIALACGYSGSRLATLGTRAALENM